MIELQTASALTDLIDQEILYPELIKFNKDDLLNYLALSQDQSAIHDPSCHKNPIIPGNMILAKLPFFLQNMIKVRQVNAIMTVGYDKISFKTPLHMNEDFQLSLTVTKVKQVKNTTYVMQRVTLMNPADKTLFSVMEIKDLYQ